MSWRIIFFESDRGEKYVEEFIKTLDSSTIAKVGHTIDLLEKFGPVLGMPHSKKLTKELYELRIRGKGEVRIIYSFVKDSIYLLSAFKKQSQKTPKSEINLAFKRLRTIDKLD